MKLEIVSHCWRYSRLLTYQLSSLVLHPPRCVEVCMTVYHAASDLPTRQVLEQFAGIVTQNVRWEWRQLEEPLLFRRAIGRNRAALATTADWVWFADADMCFGPGCLDAFPEAVAKVTGPLVFPRFLYWSANHDLGDAAIHAATGTSGPLSVNPADFALRRNHSAIGGIQICRGDVARAQGYCRDSRRYQRPANRWRRTNEDCAFRRILGTRGTPIELPNVYRIRHSKQGRNHIGVEL